MNKNLDLISNEVIKGIMQIEEKGILMRIVIFDSSHAENRKLE